MPTSQSLAESCLLVPCHPPAMPAALLAFLLLAATVDPRLAEPLRLLAEVGARDMTDGHLGAHFADLPAALDLTLAVAGASPVTAGVRLNPCYPGLLIVAER